MRVFTTNTLAAQRALGIIPQKYCYRVTLYVVPRSLSDLAALRRRVVTMIKAQYAVEDSMWPNGVTDRLEIEVPVHSYVTCPGHPTAKPHFQVADPLSNYAKWLKIKAQDPSVIVIRGADLACAFG